MEIVVVEKASDRDYRVSRRTLVCQGGGQWRGVVKSGDSRLKCFRTVPSEGKNMLLHHLSGAVGRI